MLGKFNQIRRNVLIKKSEKKLKKIDLRACTGFAGLFRQTQFSFLLFFFDIKHKHKLKYLLMSLVPSDDKVHIYFEIRQKEQLLMNELLDRKRTGFQMCLRMC